MKLPAGASVHKLEPSSGAYVDLAQSMHSPEPAPLYLPTEHFEHALAPVELLEVPAPQGVHVSLPYWDDADQQSTPVPEALDHRWELPSQMSYSEASVKSEPAAT